MSNIAYAASIAQQGLRDLGKGIGDFADKKSDAAMAEEFRKNNPGAQGETLSEGLRLGKVEVAQAEQLVAQDASLNPMTVIGSMVKKLHDPQTTPEQTSTLKQQIFGLTEVLQMQSALKKASSGGGGSSKGKNSKGVEQASNAPTWEDDPLAVISYVTGQTSVPNAMKASVNVHYREQVQKLKDKGMSNQEIGQQLSEPFQKSMASLIAQSQALSPESLTDKISKDRQKGMDRGNKILFPTIDGKDNHGGSNKGVEENAPEDDFGDSVLD